MSQLRKTNKAISQKPRLFNLIPAELALPMIAAIGAGILLFSTFNLSPFICMGASFWIGSTYWIFVGDRHWLQMSKLLPKPPNWGTAQLKYHNRHQHLPIRRKNHEQD